MLLILFYLCFVFIILFSYVKPVWGFGILLLHWCTINFTHWLFPNAIGLFAQLCDGIIFGIALRTVYFSLKKTKLDIDFLFSILIILWFALSTLYNISDGNLTLENAYRRFVRGALFWLIPVSVKQLTDRQQKIILFTAGIVSFATTLFQAYALLFRNPNVIGRAYYQFHPFSDPVAVAVDYLSQGSRLYPQGALLCQMMMILTLALILNKHKFYLQHNRLILLLFTALALFTLSLGGRSNSLAGAIAVLYLFWKTKIGTYKLLLISLLMFTVFLVSEVRFLQSSSDGIISRSLSSWNATIADKSFGDSSETRMLENQAAWNRFLGSAFWGTGSYHLDIDWEVSSGTDIHGFIQLGLFAGFPAMLLVAFWLINLFWRIHSFNRFLKNNQQPSIFLGGVGALLLATILTIINTTPMFIGAPFQIPLGIFCGIIFSTLKNVKAISTQPVRISSSNQYVR